MSNNDQLPFFTFPNIGAPNNGNNIALQLNESLLQPPLPIAIPQSPIQTILNMNPEDEQDEENNNNESNVRVDLLGEFNQAAKDPSSVTEFPGL